MSKIKVHLSAGWERFGSVGSEGLMIKGTAYLGDQRLDVAGVAADLPDSFADSKALCSFNARYNGFYALIARRNKHLVAAVDRVRSHPLFYGEAKGCFFLSNDAEWVREQVEDREMDPVAREEFQLAGYVTGQETLFPSVKQLQAGEFLIAAEDEAKVSIRCHRYYRFLHNEPSHYDEPSLRDQLDQAAVRSVQRLIEYAGGRQIVVPLSGGYDSRLIVTLLKRLGYANILTFTYGVPGNKESRYSKKVAEALELKWHFVEYTSELWREAWQTEERWAYQKWASGWSSLAHIQDWLAVKLMQEAGEVQPDCVFVPGHTGDFVAGGHIPDAAFDQMKHSKTQLSRTLYSDHYRLAPTSVVTAGCEFWEGRIGRATEYDAVTTAVHFADGYEKWNWQERQAKFICNSVRVYEFFGYDWWLPLWDKEFVEFWQEIPLALRMKREWCISYISSLYAATAHKADDILLRNASDNVIKSMLKRLPFMRSETGQKMVRLVRSVVRGQTTSATLLPLDRYPEDEVKALINQGYASNGLEAYFYLQMVAHYIK